MAQLNIKIGLISPYAKKMASRLKKLGLDTVGDCVFYYPYRYENYSRIVKAGEAKPGEEATVIGRVDLISARRSPRQRLMVTEAVITDETGSIRAVWFNNGWIAKSVKAGDYLRLWGKIGGDSYNPQFMSPDYEKTVAGDIRPAGIIPVYPLTTGITGKQLRLVINSALGAAGELPETMSEDLMAAEKLIGLGAAIKIIHKPDGDAELDAAKKRLAFEELFNLQLCFGLARLQIKSRQAPILEFKERATKDLLASLGFDLTDDQKKAAWAILKDISSTEPMNRLLEGDVGSGKTLVALLAMYNAALNGYQSVLMAPTEILASQHYKTCRKFLDGKASLGLMTRTNKLVNGESVSKKEFSAICEAGKLDLIIGTHAVIQEGISFSNLGLVIVDEQHRFGVKQRQALKEKGSGSKTAIAGKAAKRSAVKTGKIEAKTDNLVPHFLSLTATPIPRSLALVMYGDLDISIIRQIPQGRKAIITKAVAPQDRSKAYEFIAKQIKAGRQAFVICPLIDPSDKLGVRSVTEEHKKLDQEIFPDLKVGLLHGRLKGDEKEQIMDDFQANRFQILVSTSVVEVGVDVPNATVMMIEGSERFGLSQLHQFRGRVGRGEHQSYCFLFTDSPEERVLSRLDFMAGCSDGFTLAEYDMKNRGSGNIFGSEQSGFTELKLADPTDLLQAQKARDAAKKHLAGLDEAGRAALAKQLENFGHALHLE